MLKNGDPPHTSDTGRYFKHYFSSCQLWSYPQNLDLWFEGLGLNSTVLPLSCRPLLTFTTGHGQRQPMCPKSNPPIAAEWSMYPDQSYMAMQVAVINLPVLLI